MATTFYLTANAPGYTPATIRGAWDQTASAVAKGLEQGKTGGGLITSVAIAETNATNPWRVLLGRWISGPLAASTIGGAGTLNVILGIVESTAAADLNYYLHVYVTQGNSDTPRGTLLADYSEGAGVNEWPTTATGKALNASQTLASVTLSAGDRIVVEIGYAARNSVTTSFSGTLNYGTQHPTSGAIASDLTAGSTSVTTLAGSITFSDTITEQSQIDRVSQLVAEVVSTGLPKARVSQMVVEVVVPSGTSPERVSQFVVELAQDVPAASHLARVSQLVVEIVSANPEVIFTNDRVPGLTHIEITLSDDTVEAWSVIPMDDPPDYDHGNKRPRVLAWGDIRRAAGDFYGQSIAADFKFTVRDKDLHVLGYLGDPANVFTNRYTVTKSITDPDRRLENIRRTIFRGPIRSVAPRAGAIHEFTIKDYLQERFGPNSDTASLPRRRVLKADFDACDVELVNSSAEQYVVDGPHVIGATDISVRDGVGTFAADQITFDNHATVYTISASSLDDPETQITINPALTDNVPDGTGITQIPTHRVAPAKGDVVPVRGGLMTDRKIDGGIDAGDGQGTSIYAGDEVMADGFTYAIFVWACHGCYSPDGKPFQQLYFWNGAMEGPGSLYYDGQLVATAIGDLATEAGSGGRVLMPGYDNWADNGFTGSYEDRNGRRYVWYGLRGILRDWAIGVRGAPMNLGGVPHTVNGYGMDSTLDGLGDEVIDIHDQFVLTVNNFGWGDYQSGAPLPDPTFPDDPSLTLIDLVSVARAKAHGATLVTGGFRGDWRLPTVGNELITMAELIERFVRCMGVEQGWNRKTQFCIDRQIFDEETAMADAPTLTDERDIRKRSFEIDEAPSLLFTALPFVHTPDEAGRSTSGWRSTTADFNVADQVEEFADDAGTITKYSPSGTKLYSQPLEFHFLRGKNRSSDADEYQQGSDTINAILEYKLAMAKVRIFTLTTWGKGYSIDMFDRVWIQHLANVGGRTPRPARVIEHIAHPDRWRCTLKCFDLGRIFA